MLAGEHKAPEKKPVNPLAGGIFAKFGGSSPAKPPKAPSAATLKESSNKIDPKSTNERRPNFTSNLTI